jgi:hypothetical protein
MGDDGWAFDILRGFGDYAYADDRHTRPRRSDYDDENDLFEDEYDEEE